MANNNDYTVYGIIHEFKAYPLFYSLLIWIFVWFASIVWDKYHHKIKIDETNLGIDFMRRKMVNQDKMEEIEKKFNLIMADSNPNIDTIPKYFYMDSGIIELLYSIREFKYYSRPIWRKLIDLLDKFLEIDFYCNQYPSDTHIWMDNLLDLKKNILNELHSMVFNVPTDDDSVSQYKLYKAGQSLQFILNFHLEHLRKKNNNLFNKNGPNTRNKYINILHKEEPGELNANKNTTKYHIHQRFDFY